MDHPNSPTSATGSLAEFPLLAPFVSKPLFGARVRSPLDLPLRARRIFRVQRLGPSGAIHQLAAAIGAAVVKLLGAGSAKGAFEAANEGTGRIGGKIHAAALAIGTHFKHL